MKYFCILLITLVSQPSFAAIADCLDVDFHYFANRSISATDRQSCLARESDAIDKCYARQAVTDREALAKASRGDYSFGLEVKGPNVNAIEISKGPGGPQLLDLGDAHQTHAVLAPPTPRSQSERQTEGAISGVVKGLMIGGIVAILLMLRALWRKTKQIGRAVAPPLRNAAALGVGVTALAARDFVTRNKICPYCRETVKREATICKHCRQNI